MKEVNIVKTTGLDARFEALLHRLLGKIPFLQLINSCSCRGPKHPKLTGFQPDLIAEVHAGNRSRTLLIETKQIGQPRQIRTAALQLSSYLAGLPDKSPRYGIIFAPFISQQSAQICEENNLGYADLAGNARISFDNVYIETRAAGNPFRERKEIKSLFAPKACRVLKVLLQGPLRPWKTIELASESNVSTGWVSAVRQQLIGREWAVSASEGVRVSNPNAVLEAWTAVDQWRARTDVQEYSLLLTDPSEIAKSISDFLGDRRHAFTQWFAGWLRHPYTIPPVVTAYVNDFPDQKTIEARLLARRVEEGGRLWLIRPSDPGVFLRSQLVHGFSLVSDIQIYLDLLAAGRRGDEQATELRKWPDFSGGWNP